MKSTGEWKFRIAPHRLIFEGYWKSFTPRKPKKKFSLFGGMKIYSDEKTLWTNEDVFMKRYKEREPLTQDQLLEKFTLKYETIFRWILVAFNKKEVFWENIRRDWANGQLDCYEIRMEEIVNSFTDVTRKCWRNQKRISARNRRTKLFQSEIFKNRSSCSTFGYEAFGKRRGTFAKEVLYHVRCRMLRSAGCQIGGME
jgi:hypothetical protein